MADPSGKTQHELATEKRNKRKPTVNQTSDSTEPAYRRDGVHSSNKKQRSDDGFRKPEGFEDARKGGGGREKTMSRREEKKLAHVERTRIRRDSKLISKAREEGPVWGKMGEERTWDVGKSVEDPGEDDDSFNFEDDYESEEDEEEVRLAVELLNATARREKKEKKQKAKAKVQLDEQTIDDALESAEGSFGDQDAEIKVRAKKSKKDKKQKESKKVQG